MAPHDHGIRECLFVYRGRFKHTVWNRVDDGTQPGYAEIEVTDDRVLERPSRWWITS